MSATATSKFTLQLNFKKAYNPGYMFYDQILLLTPLPRHVVGHGRGRWQAGCFTTLAGAEKIYKFLDAQSLKLSTYATNPLWQVVDGPFKLTQFNPPPTPTPWSPNPNYSGPKRRPASSRKWRSPRTRPSTTRCQAQVS